MDVRLLAVTYVWFRARAYAVNLQLRFDYDKTRSEYDVSRAPASIRRDSTRAKNEHVNISSSSYRSRIAIVI